MEEQNSDERSGTEEDSDNAVNAAGGMAGATSGGIVDAASINDYNGYQNIFRPRRRELNRTPPMDDEPFQAPMSGSESESNSRPSNIRLQMQKRDAGSNPLQLAKKEMKKPSPSPTRRSSHPVRMRKTSTNSATGGSSPTTNSSSSQPQPLRPTSVYHEDAASSSPVSAHRNQRATSVQPRSSSDLVCMIRTRCRLG